MTPETLLSFLNDGLLLSLVGLGWVYFICGIDDLSIDLIALTKKLKPKELSPFELKSLQKRTEKKFAIIVPAWKEAGIIRRMLLGNIARLEYKNYHFFIGVYPNDPATVKEVEAVQSQFPQVHAVINSLHGPTSKGQILNHVITQIFEFETKNHLVFDAFLMQDAEDLMHPKILQLMNQELEQADFVQTPVFCLDRHPKQVIAGTYMDEFAESHTKDLMVRNHLKAAIPSAGVGTAFTRTLVNQLLNKNGNCLFNEKTLTEDYELGITVHRMGYKTNFANYFYRTLSEHNSKPLKEFIATREYFPAHFKRSVRQKTRWSIGIALQSTRNQGWMGSWKNRYFLLRDRRAIFTNVLTVCGYFCAFFTTIYALFHHHGPMAALFSEAHTKLLFSSNVALMANRLFQRARCVHHVYGGIATIAIPIRWPVATVINALASLQAIRQDFISQKNKTPVPWVKTEHELPNNFGIAPEMRSTA